MARAIGMRSLSRKEARASRPGEETPPTTSARKRLAHVGGREGIVAEEKKGNFLCAVKRAVTAPKYLH